MMDSVEKFEDLRVWQNARKLANMIYDFSSVGDFARDFGLRDQMRRAAVSVMSNIAEGFESRTQAMFIEYLGRAKASAGVNYAPNFIWRWTGTILIKPKCRKRTNWREFAVVN